MKKILVALFSTFLFVSLAHATDSARMDVEQNATLDGTWGSGESC